MQANYKCAWEEAHFKVIREMLVLNREDPQLKTINRAHFAACSQTGMRTAMSILNEMFSALEEHPRSARHCGALPGTSRYPSRH